MKMKNIKILLLLTLGVFITNCNKIDDVPLEFNQIEKVLADSISVQQFVTSIYTHLPNGYNRINNAMAACITDEAVHSAINSNVDKMAKGAWGPNFNPDDAWSTNYQGIRKSNDFLLNVVPNIREFTFKSQATIDNLIGEAKFLRALYHFELIKRYGGIPIVEEVFEASSNPNIARNTYDECIQFVSDECDEAAALLTDVYESDNKYDLGRATKAAALALKARTLLYAASPLFNDPAKTNDSFEHGAYSAEKWKLAADAAADVILLGTNQLYNSFDRFFTTLAGNNEIILSRMATPNFNIEKLNGPSGYLNANGGTGPTLNLVDAFLMADGTVFDWNNPVHAANPFEGRDPRFASSILTNGTMWMGRKVETFEGGLDMGANNSTKTGFYLRKFLDPSARWFGGTTGKTYHCFPIFRFAEVLLNYAEAMNEYYGYDVDPKGIGYNAKEAVEKIRERAKISPFQINPTTKDEMREIIRHERQIELAFEEHRQWDVRRWKIAEDVLGGPVYCLKITKDPVTSELSYEKVKVEDRVFTPNMYLYPFPQKETNQNAELGQNTGW